MADPVNNRLLISEQHYSSLVNFPDFVSNHLPWLHFWSSFLHLLLELSTSLLLPLTASIPMSHYWLLHQQRRARFVDFATPYWQHTYDFSLFAFLLSILLITNSLINSCPFSLAFTCNRFLFNSCLQQLFFELLRLNLFEFGALNSTTSFNLY